jgi:hypothetical protein
VNPGKPVQCETNAAVKVMHRRILRRSIFLKDLA